MSIEGQGHFFTIYFPGFVCFVLYKATISGERLQDHWSSGSDVQGQITLVFVVVSGRNFNSSKLLCMSSLPARMRMINSKMKELECSQDFSHYKSMGIFPDLQGQLTPQSLVRSGRISNLSKMLWMSS